MQKIILSQSDKKILVEHAKNEEPNESCAILLGKDSLVLEVFLTKNIKESPTNFTISNEQLMKGYDIAKEKKIEVVGIFHSHPNSDAYPSDTDKKFMQINPVAWIIYSGLNKDVRAFFLESGIVEIPIKEK